MNVIWLYTLGGVFIVSLISFVGVLALAMKKEKLEHFLLYFVSFSVGALLGDVFIHIIPHITEEHGFNLQTGLYFLLGIVVFFVVEKFIHWHHCHKAEHEHTIKPLAYTNLIGDGLHNLLDGVIIASSFMVSVPVGIATTLAVIFHEIPQEIGDFGVLLYAGFKKKTALLFNFASALLAVVGAVLTLLLAQHIHGLEVILLAVAGGGFIYIAGSDLIPELHKGECTRCHAAFQLLFILLGMAVMAGLVLFE
ncbi:ZIP family metal transporter [Candidatus Falkowbacteria bacterium]|jgi:zinc and cadmium transporter|nr:ZIP family metal transporter [Candidatus Falkowbacteria bacterium]MBT5502597.1 ZIP family metal transporter [Candidatus Falkowbacteria bacterium]MBT6574594.1 ZIP family metal transporter [Candidatus Falkowbacteria bacterium]MBT7349005.1 ZIP family metal transporter [Candidatus Falkowbacteria bacterium]MBT7500347.1 ZIP family metal transporter [Candidatus Falkowbacteria bacterium]